MPEFSDTESFKVARKRLLTIRQAVELGEAFKEAKVTPPSSHKRSTLDLVSESQGYVPQLWAPARLLPQLNTELCHLGLLSCPNELIKHRLRVLPAMGLWSDVAVRIELGEVRQLNLPAHVDHLEVADDLAPVLHGADPV